ncbi:MAG: AmmeMemoRadiSam system protein B [Patescibacteria group bacterium]|jgi:AmmeMemoRadiSam system protein B
MPIVFSAITPHPPILIPTIGKENVNQLKATSEAFLKLEQDLYASQAETIIVISPHGHLQEEAFTMNLSPEFTISFEDFGDLTTKLNLAGDVGLAHKIREKLETKAALQLTSEPELDHGSSVPIYLLTQHLPKIKIIPLYYSGLDLTSHYEFGKMLKSQLLNSDTRIAIIASGDLSHRLTKNAPAGYSPKGKKFDQKLIDCLLKKETEEIIKFKQELIDEAGECGLKSIMILLGILEGVKYEPQLLSYEYPFGVGYLVMNLEL